MRDRRSETRDRRHENGDVRQETGTFSETVFARIFLNTAQWSNVLMARICFSKIWRVGANVMVRKF